VRSVAPCGQFAQMKEPNASALRTGNRPGGLPQPENLALIESALSA